MSNGVQIFVNMKSYIFLIILLGLIKIVFCTHLANVSIDDDTCPVTWFRRKRANMDYTRWRANMETTPQFIVKILDDEMPQPSPSIVAVNNILPETDRREKIIVGGAMVPPPPASTSISAEQLREYTRFVPPTTNTRTTEELGLFVPHLAEKIEDSIIEPEIKNVYRDESPPVSPRFIPRGMPTGYPRQYAPIAPVAFTRRSTVSPLTPPLQDELAYAVNYPTRTSSSQAPPTRTSVIDELPIIQAYLEEDINNNILNPTRIATVKEVTRTTEWLTEEIDPKLFEDDMLIPRSTVKPFKEMLIRAYEELASRKGNQKAIQTQTIDNGENKDSDSYFNVNSNNEDYKDVDSKKPLDYSVSEESETVFETTETTENIFGGDVNITELPYPEDSFASDNGTDQAILVLREIPPKSLDEKQSKDKRRPVCNMIRLRQLNFNSPRTLPEIVAQMKQWTEESPVAKWADITEGNLTTMENPIYVMIVDDPSVGQVASAKQNVLLIAGIQGRDHHAVAAAFYVLYQLIERSESHYDLLSKYRFWVIPVFNPDGYDYSMTFPQRREWVKNLRQTWDSCKGRESCKFCETHGLRCTVSPCYGVNLDRNFEYQWIPPEELRAEHPCGNLYAGQRQLSEAETQALTNFLHGQKITISVFLSFKEGSVLGVMYPYSHTKKKRAFDQIYRHRANRAAAAAYSIAGRSFIAGQTSEFLPLYAGGIEDWADGHLGIDNTYTIMMFRPADTANSKYMTERVIHETYAAMDSLLLSSLATDHQNPVLALARSRDSNLHPDIVTILYISFAGFFIANIC